MSEKLTNLRGEWRTLERLFDMPGPVTVLRFICPKCPRDANGMSHWVGVPVSDDGRPGTWKRNGTNLDTLTLTPSIDVTKTPLAPCPGESVFHAADCLFHGFVQEGYVV